jgi:hypothetical protein
MVVDDLTKGVHATDSLPSPRELDLLMEIQKFQPSIGNFLLSSATVNFVILALLLSIFILILLPITWYFLLERLAEISNAIRGKHSK